MKKFELYINNVLADYDTAGFSITLDKIVSNFNDVLKKTGSYSYTIKLPKTANNSRIFDQANDKQTIGKFLGTYDCRLVIDETNVLSGTFVLRSTGKYFEGFISGSKELSIADIVGSGNLQDIQSFQPVTFRGDATVHDYLGRQLAYIPSYITGNTTQSEICFPLVVDSTWKMINFDYYSSFVTAIDTNRYTTKYDDFPPAIFAGAIFENIFKDVNYKLQGNILESDEFKRLCLLYSDENGEEQPWNYATLNPFTATVNSGSFSKQIIRDATEDEIDRGNADNNYYIIYAHDVTFDIVGGDTSFSGRLAEGETSSVYIPKYTGEYTFESLLNFRNVTTIQKSTSGGWGSPETFDSYDPFIQIDNYFAIVEVDIDSPYLDDEFLKFPFGGSIFIPRSNEKVKLYSQYIDGYTSTQGDGSLNVAFSGSCILEKGKQYKLQLYSIYHEQNATLFNSYELNINPGGYFSLEAVNGKNEINVADFLPANFKRIDFVNSIFKLYNLYYDIDYATKTVTLFTRDEYFALNSGNIVDLSQKCSISEFESTPFDADFSNIYSVFSTDEKDYLLKTSDYLVKINGITPENAYNLPFSPLTFFKKAFSAGIDSVPMILTVESAKPANYNSVSFENGYVYKPRLAYFQNNSYALGLTGLTSTSNLPVINFVRSITNDKPFGRRIMPGLTFVNVLDQPYYTYDLTNDVVFVSGTTTDVNHAIDEEFKPEISIDDQNIYSLSLNKSFPLSVFRRFYKNNLIINDLSNFEEGRIKMDSVLWEKLTGREIIRIGDDQYLLDEITNYTLTSNQANLKIYKLLVG